MAISINIPLYNMPPVKSPPRDFSTNPEIGAFQAIAPLRLESHLFPQAPHQYPANEKARFLSDAINWVGTRIEDILYRQFQIAQDYHNKKDLPQTAITYDYVGERKLLEKARIELKETGKSATAVSLMDEYVCRSQFTLEESLQHVQDAIKTSMAAQIKLKHSDRSNMESHEYTSLQEEAQRLQRQAEIAQNIYKAQELAIQKENTRIDEMVIGIGGIPRTQAERSLRMEELRTSAKTTDGTPQERYRLKLTRAGGKPDIFEEDIIKEHLILTLRERQAVHAMRRFAEKKRERNRK